MQFKNSYKLGSSFWMRRKKYYVKSLEEKRNYLCKDFLPEMSSACILLFFLDKPDKIFHSGYDLSQRFFFLISFCLIIYLHACKKIFFERNMSDFWRVFRLNAYARTISILHKVWSLCRMKRVDFSGNIKWFHLHSNYPSEILKMIY